MRIKTITKIGVVVVASLAFGSCKDFLSPTTGTTLLENDNYKRSVQVKANFLGVAASFQQIAEHWIILSELRGDLVEPTYNAPAEFWDVYNYRVDSENSLVNPSVYYRAIINCNDFVRHAVSYDIKYPGVIASALAKGMIADALRFRAWCYLTLGKLYGEVIYYDIALVDDVDILEDPDDWKSNMDSIYFDGRPEYKPEIDPVTGEIIDAPRPEGAAIRMSLSRLVDDLIDHLNTGVKGYDGFATFNWTDLTNNTDMSWNRLGVNPNALMGELYMWKAAFNPGQEFPLYQKALSYLMQVPNTSGALNTFTLALTTTGGTWATSNWSNIFTNSAVPIASEIITMLPFYQSHQQQNKLQYYYEQAPTNAYYLRPTNIIFDMYDNSPKTSGYGDTKRKEASVDSRYGENYVVKFSRGKTDVSRDCPIIIYRAGEIHLMIAECLNHLGMHQEAFSFFGSGLKQHWQDGFYEYPFSNPLFGNNLRMSPGVRGRVDQGQYKFALTVAEAADVDNKLVFDARAMTDSEKKFFVDSLIANEMAMECAFEGKRYFTLLRQSIFWDNTDYFANTLSAKYEDPSTINIALRDKKNWFFDYKQTELY